VYIKRHRGHSSLYQVDYGEDACVALIVVRSVYVSTERLFLVKQSDSIESADGRVGFGVNPLRKDGLWPSPPREAVRDAVMIVRY
jgi:hypothetical protein